MSRTETDVMIGANLKITMANNKVYEGAVFAYDPKQTIVLVNNCNNDKPNFNILNTFFIKSVEASTKNEALAPGVAPGARLPKCFDNLSREADLKMAQMKKGRDADIFKKIEQLEKHTVSIPIGALDVLTKLVRAWGSSTEWDKVEECFVINEKIKVTKSASGSWAEPAVVKIVDDADCEDMCKRIRPVFAKKL